MNPTLRAINRVPLLLLACYPAMAAITIPGVSGTPVAGSDGPLLVDSGTTIDLSKASIGTWDGAPEIRGTGVYDPEKWAVVFKYSSVTIQSALRFRNNATRAPVVWLVSGDVNISGSVIINAESANERQFAEPGPGGFRGGPLGPETSGGGHGPGGGNQGNSLVGGQEIPGPGSHSTQPSFRSGPTYGSTNIPALIGGSGGGSDTQTHAGGGGGGGALLIIATGKLTIDGMIDATGGDGTSYSGPGAGGAVRIVASELQGKGRISVAGGRRGADYAGSHGYIRAEAEQFGPNSLSADPVEISSVVISGAARIWPEETSAMARIVSVSNLPVPSDPRADLGLAPTDVNVPFIGSREVRIETRNFPTAGTVTLFVTPSRGERTSLSASLLPGGTTTLATWQTTLDASLSGRVALQVRAVAE